MSRDWEAQFRAWSVPPGTTEQEKTDRAEREVRAAVQASSALTSRDLRVFPQGSYRNRTNVPRESDVDICVLCLDTFWWEEYPHDDNLKKSVEAKTSPASYGYTDFKNDLGAALVARFGATAVARGDKAFDVRETRSRVEADVVAAFEHRRYTRFDYNGNPAYISGIEFLPDSGGLIINWPQQHYDNGVAKNDRTRERFKAMVRVVKNLRNEMDDYGVAEAKPIPSYLIECLVFNVPDEKLGHARYYDELKELLRFLYHATATQEPCNEWGEVNELKYLFRASQPWTREAANAFVLAAWQYVGFKD